MNGTHIHAEHIDEAYQLFQDGILAFAEMEQQGMRVDVEYIEKKNKQIDRKILKLETVIYDSDFFREWQMFAKKKVNIYSPVQMENYLYKHLNLKVAKQTKSGKGSTDEETLGKLNIPELDTLLEIKKLKKIQSTYLAGFLREQVDGVIHPNFNLHLVISMRSSVDSPNLQNIPKRDKESMKICRQALYPRVGYQLMELDFSQLEVRTSCIIGNTKIETIDGSQTIKRIIGRLKNNDDVFVYGYDFNKQRIAVSKVIDGGITGNKKEVYNVMLDNGESIIATPDHKFLTRSGKYIPLNKLEIGTSLMPFYKKNKKSHWGTVYQEVYLNNGEKMLAHNLIAEDVRGVVIKGSNKLVHHKYGNGCDNSLKNTQIMTRKRHMRIHSVQSWKNDSRKGNIHWSSTDEGKSALSQQTKEQWNKLKYFEKEEIKLRIKEGLKKSKGNVGENNGMFGKHHSDESKQKNKNSHLGKIMGSSWNKGLTKETSKIVAKMVEKANNTRKINGNPRKGKKCLYEVSEHTRELRRINATGKIHTEESKEKNRKVALKRWENNKPTACAICKKEFISITNTHLLNKHHITNKEYKETYNHKIVSIDFYGYEDVYNINVEGIHNYATSAGVIIKNCAYHKDPTMIKYIETDHDFHKDLAMQIFNLKEYDPAIHKELRQAAKNGFVFAEFYGDYYKNCVKNIATNWCKLSEGTWKKGQGIMVGAEHVSDLFIRSGITSYSKLEKHLEEIENDLWGNRFPVYDKWRNDHWKEYQKNGYLISKTGFLYTGIMSRNDVYNYENQGSAFHVMLWCLIQATKKFKELKLKTRIVNQIHDSILLDVFPPEREQVTVLMKRIMERDVRKHWDWINVPLKVDASLSGVDCSWAESKED